MNRRTFALLTAVLTFSVGIVLAKLSLPNPFKTPPPIVTLEIVKQIQLSNYRLTGPYEYNNLKIFLVHAPDMPQSVIYTTLADAMARKVVVVHETGNVNELAIENVSPFEEVLVQAGDIVKGGRQDRVLAVDLILPSKSGVVPISAFCVEQARWQAREGESVDHFTMTEMAANYSILRAVKDIADQAFVWGQVEASQNKIGAGVARSVRSQESRTSLVLAFENDTVRHAVAPYTSNLYSLPHRWNDVIGFVHAIDDEIMSADVYSSNMLFKKSWHRLLQAAAIEAVATARTDGARDPLSIETVASFLTGAEQGTETVTRSNPRTLSLKRTTETELYFETRDTAYDGTWVHRNYLKRITD